MLIILSAYSAWQIIDLDKNVTENIIKGILLLLMSLLILFGPHSPYLVSSFVYVCLSIGYIVVFYDIVVGYDMGIAGRNYLTLTMPVVISSLFTIIKLFEIKYWLIRLFLVTIALLQGYYLISSQSRAAFILLLLCSLYIFFVKRKHFVFPLNYWYIGIPGIILYFNTFFIEFLENFNYVLYARILRLFSSDEVAGVSEEDRVTIYGSAIDKILNDPTGLGYGLNASNKLFDLPYIESFILEYLLIFGFLGVIAILCKTYFLIYGLLQSNKYKNSFYLYVLYICLFSFFVKGWSVFDSYVIYLLIALWLKEVLRSKTKDVFCNNTHL